MQTSSVQSQNHRWDVIVVGAGMGGGLAARRLTERGLSVLVLEAGPETVDAPPPPSRLRRMLRRLAGGYAPADHDRWPVPLHMDRGRGRMRPVPAMIGRGRGGSSTLYGAALGRFRRVDIEREVTEQPQGCKPDRAMGERPLPTRWPLPFDALRPFYAEAEAALGIVGTRDPLDPDDDALLRPPPALSPQDAALAATLRANGLNPFRLHVGFEYRPGCAECPGRRCPRGCKAEGDSRGVAPALRAGASLRQGMAVRRIELDETGVTLICRDGDGGEHRFPARSCVLAAGALNTPLVLARSPALWHGAEPHPLLGRGLMFHVSDMFAVFERSGAPAFGPRKTLGLRDLYTVDGAIWGEVQSMGLALNGGMITAFLKKEAMRLGLGWLGPLLELLRIPGHLGARVVRDAAIFATILEDLPYRRNRVWEMAGDGETATGRIAVAYTVATELADRAAAMRPRLRAAFRPHRLLFLNQPAMPNIGHAMGTCRMGASAETGVVSPDGAVWADPRVCVADGSVLPSSGGANPSLTIAALALRTADLLADRLGAPALSFAAKEPA